MSLDDWLKVGQILTYLAVLVYGLIAISFLIIKGIYNIKILKFRYIKEKQPDEWVEEE